MSEWINLKESPPTGESGFVLGVDWYCTDQEDEFRIHICELPCGRAFWCGEDDGPALDVLNSICPKIGHGYNSHWMPIPKEGWIKFKKEKYPYDDSKEVLIKLYNGNFYVAYIHDDIWIPAFSGFKNGYNESIESWQELPKPPIFVKETERTEEEKKIQKEFLEKWMDK